MAEARWLADEMLGRLARYLRVLGYDTEYVRGADDDAVAARAVSEGRTLLTRDRALAARVPGALRLDSPTLADQLRALQRAVPDLRREVAFARCTLCNGPLAPAPPDPHDPEAAARRAGATWRCGRCGHRYWEGSHTASMRRTLAAALGRP